MPLQRRPPPPPPDDDSPPPPLPNRFGPASTPTQPPMEDAPPPLPNRTHPTSLGSKTQGVLSPPPAQCQDDYLLPSEEPQKVQAQDNQQSSINNEYHSPDEPDGFQETYEVINSLSIEPQYTDVSKDTYEEMCAPPPVPLKPQVPAPQVHVPQVVPVTGPRLPQIPLKPKLPQTMPKPVLPHSADKEKPKSSVKAWNSFREWLPKSKSAEIDDRKRKTSVPAKWKTEEKADKDDLQLEADQTYELPDADPPIIPRSQDFDHRRKDDGLSDDDGDWDSEFSDDDGADFRVQAFALMYLMHCSQSV
ncbi:hypothetical protein ElyMa_003830100 [Elysia marginata]|uniref:Uncharacterized protein n=1 Tax=Elysia marginata TaxID=1093978 RepID=A0AAV4FG79_9GAST|nr:hypothetical protein ElyMa_003830100 [Elysia marginata]